MFLPAEIIAVVAHFAPAFSRPTYEKAVELLLGTLLARGRRTVTSALRALGKEHEPGFSKYHQVLNRAKWSGLELSQLLVQLLVSTLLSGTSTVTVAVDETLERRWGPQIRKRGHWRDSLASSRKQNVSSSGLRWLVFAIVLTVPWTPYAMALPFLSVLLTTAKVSQKLGKRHKTVACVSGQVVAWLRRTLAGRALHLVGDGAYAVIELGLICQRQQVTLIAPLRLDARLFEPPFRPVDKRRGRPAVVGTRLANLAEVARLATTRWQRSQLLWYGGTTAVVDWVAGTALWYTTGTQPLAIRWVLVRDPLGVRPTRAFFSTDPSLPAPNIIGDFVKRWPLEVTFEEGRAHLGIETQRQWSDLAIERSTPALFGLFSLVVLMAHSLYPDGQLPSSTTAWYPKAHVTFHDLLALVRRRIWLHCFFQTGTLSPDLRLISHAQFEHLLSAVCY
jgi:DDE superfamily endonuclease